MLLVMLLQVLYYQPNYFQVLQPHQHLKTFQKLIYTGSQLGSCFVSSFVYCFVKDLSQQEDAIRSQIYYFQVCYLLEHLFQPYLNQVYQFWTLVLPEVEIFSVHLVQNIWQDQIQNFFLIHMRVSLDQLNLNPLGQNLRHPKMFCLTNELQFRGL